MAKFCPNCGSKIYDNKKFCGDCGCEVDASIIKTPQHFEPKNNTHSTNFQNHYSEVDRSPEMILAIIGGVLGLIMGVYSFYAAYILYSISSRYNSILNLVGFDFSGLGGFLTIGATGCIIFATITLIAAIVSLSSGILLKKNPKLYGILLIIAAIGFIFSISWFNYICVICVGVAGILALIRK